MTFELNKFMLVIANDCGQSSHYICVGNDYNCFFLSGNLMGPIRLCRRGSGHPETFISQYTAALH
eukprot:137346-Amphidinium_carterae.1